MQAYMQNCSYVALKQMLAAMQCHFTDHVIHMTGSRAARSRSRIRLRRVEILA
jgi:hypothetical protein